MQTLARSGGMVSSYALAYAAPHAHKCTGGVHTAARRRARGKRSDPTRTAALRRQYEAQFIKRLRRVIKSMRAQVATRNELDIAANKKYSFSTDQEKVHAFTAWFERAINKALFGNSLDKDFDSAIGTFWGNSFANIAYRRGMLRAIRDLKRAGAKVAPEYLTNALKRGFHGDTLKKLYTRQFDDLRNITREMSKQVGETLAEGLASGLDPFGLADKLVDRVEKIGITRARLLARTEVISTYAEAELNVLDEAGVQGVELEPELMTAGDERVCDQCEAAARQSYTVEGARGVIPLHPNCRCAWAPLIKNGKEIELR